MKKPVFIAGLIFICCAAVAQELQHDVTVTLKLIQVHVTDEEGRPVQRSEKADFVLFDNGIKQNITDFETYFLTAKASEALGHLLKIPETEPKEPDLSSSKMNRKFFILIDLDRVSFPNIKRSKEMVLHFLDTQLHPTDEVGSLLYRLAQGLCFISIQLRIMPK